MIPLLNEDNYVDIAMNHYHASIISTEEFTEDLNRIRYIKRLLKKYKSSGDIKVRLVLNHLRVLYNVFTPPYICTNLLIFRLDEYLPELKPFLIVLNYWSDKKIEGIEKFDNFYGSDICLDENIVKLLREEFKGIRIGY
jgi:hypothetical protein